MKLQIDARTLDRGEGQVRTSWPGTGRSWSACPGWASCAAATATTSPRSPKPASASPRWISVATAAATDVHRVRRRGRCHGRDRSDRTARRAGKPVGSCARSRHGPPRALPASGKKPCSQYGSAGRTALKTSVRRQVGNGRAGRVRAGRTPRAAPPSSPRASAPTGRRQRDRHAEAVRAAHHGPVTGAGTAHTNPRRRSSDRPIGWRGIHGKP